MIGVKNNTGSEISARYDGKDYVFKPGVPTAIPPDAATHIFGFGLEDKTRALQRLGWMRHQAQYAEAVKQLDDIQFLAVENQFHEPAAIPSRPMNDPLNDESRFAVDKGTAQGRADEKIQIPQFTKSGAK